MRRRALGCQNKILDNKGYVWGCMAVVLGAVGLVGQASAVTYQSNVGLNFTFNPSISISLSGSGGTDLVIDDLRPGLSSDSNTITVGVTTNSVAGYSLSATVGTKGGTSALTSSDNNTFTNLSTTAGAAADLAAFSDNTWGYSYCPDTAANCAPSGSATWISGSIGENGATGSSAAGYAGLPLDNNDNASDRGMGGVTLINTTNAADSKSVEFKIGARASNTQPAGTYTNTINFYAVSYAPPVTLYDAYYAAGKTMLNGYYKLQDMDSSICAAVDVDDNQLQVIDTRDNKVYWIAKLKDGHCWMTQDLKLDLDSNTTYTHDNTDLGWGSDTATTSWTPMRSTIPTSNISSGTISGWTNDSKTPYSANLGDWYYAGYSGTGDVLPSTTVNYLTTTNTTYFNTTSYTVNGEHGHLGNYYNWSAAVAMNDTSAYTTSTQSDITANPQNSVCPAGWRLPTISSASSSTAGSTNEFMRLNYIYNDGSTSNSKAMEGSPLFFSRGGYVGGSLSNSGNRGSYWSSTVHNSDRAYTLGFYATSVSNYNDASRYNGRLVRCVAR